MKNLFKRSALLALFQLLPSTWGYAQDQKAKLSQMVKGFAGAFDAPVIQPKELERWLKGKKNLVLVDVRSPKERKVSMIPGAISREAFEQLPKDPQRTVVSYCTIGYRSGKFTEALRKDGVQAFNLEGSILAWVLGGGQVVDAKGPTKRVHVYGPRWNLLPEGYQAVFSD